jgi:hypothetical protein
MNEKEYFNNLNSIKTWQQGHFIHFPRYRNWSKEKKEQAERDENKSVRPGPTDNAICFCNNSDDAKWIAQRLNLATKFDRIKSLEIKYIFEIKTTGVLGDKFNVEMIIDISELETKSLARLKRENGIPLETKIKERIYI